MKLSYLLAVLSVATASCSGHGDSVKPKVKPLIEAVYASGFVAARNQYNVTAQTEGTVAEKVVEDGARVRKGDPLFIIENEQTSSRFELARKNFAIARQHYGEGSPVLEEARTAMHVARTKMQYDSVNFSRFENLLRQNATTRSEFDRAKLSLESSSNEYRLQKSRFERIQNQMLLELENARNQLTIAGDESGKHIVRSDIDGLVFKTLKEQREVVRRGEVLAIVGDSTDYYLQLLVDELDVQKVKPGQEVQVTIDAFPGRVFRAMVEKIYPMVNQQQQSVRADAVLKEKLPAYFNGLAVEANIVIRRNNSALVVPRSALKGDTLHISTADGVKAIRVTPGIQTLEEVEIRDGIDSTTEVLIN